MRWLFFVISTFSIAAVILSAADGDDLPAGEGKDVLLTMCTNCHGLAQVTSVKYSEEVLGGRSG